MKYCHILISALLLLAFMQDSGANTIEKKYIAFGWEFRNLTPAQILSHADRFKELPIDGVGIVLSAKNPKGGKFSQISITDDPPWTWDLRCHPSQRSRECPVRIP